MLIVCNYLHSFSNVVFSTHLPLFIIDKLSIDENCWKHYLLFLLHKMHSLYDSFPKISYKVKNLSRIHWLNPNKVGLLILCCCLEIEAKNSYFKMIAQIENFKDLPFSFASHQQKIYVWLSSKQFFLLGTAMRSV